MLNDLTCTCKSHKLFLRITAVESCHGNKKLHATVIATVDVETHTHETAAAQVLPVLLIMCSIVCHLSVTH